MRRSETSGGTIRAELEVRFLPRQEGQPKHLLASADLVLRTDGRLPDMKITGFALWKSRGEERLAVTMPHGDDGRDECFLTVSGRIKDLVRFKREMLRAYEAWAARRNEPSARG